MGFLKLFSVLLVIGCGFAEEEKLPEACTVEDIPCFNKFNKEFLEKTAGGLPKYGLKAIDPLIFPTFELKLDGGTAVYKNLKVTGLKNEEIVDIKLDRTAKIITFSCKENVKIEGDFDVTFPKKSESYPGKYSSTTDALLIGNYSYELETDDKGVQHIHILNITLKCEHISVNATRDEELEKVINADPELKNRYTETEIEEVNKVIVCKILEKSADVMNDNFKLATDYYPATAFFKNI